MTSTPIQLVFLGTGSAQPSSTRNHSSLALNLNSETWLFDCGEGTQHQILKAPSVKITRIRRFFITHLHGDHCFGLPGLLCTLAGTYSNQDTNYHVEIIGPKNTRLYIRNALIMTGSSLGMVRYTVHELVMSSDHAVPINNEDPMNNYINDVTESQNTVPVIQSTLHQNEDMGKDITPGIDEIWRNIVIESGWTVHAGPLEHRIQCLGFVLEEDSMTGSLILEKVMPLITKHKDALTVQLNGKNPMSLISNLKLPGGRIDFPDGTVLHSHECVSPDRPGRKIVILGDTCNSNLLKDISMDADLLVHEATNACLKVIFLLIVVRSCSRPRI